MLYWKLMLNPNVCSTNLNWWYSYRCENEISKICETLMTKTEDLICSSFGYHYLRNLILGNREVKPFLVFPYFIARWTFFIIKVENGLNCRIYGVIKGSKRYEKYGKIWHTPSLFDFLHCLFTLTKTSMQFLWLILFTLSCEIRIVN